MLEITQATSLTLTLNLMRQRDLDNHFTEAEVLKMPASSQIFVSLNLFHNPSTARVSCGKF